MKRYFDLNNNTDNNFCDEIDETFMVEIPDDNKPYGLVDGQVTDVSDTEAYKREIAELEKQNKITVLKSQIVELEALQSRSIRELILNPANEFAKTKLQEIETQIEVVRNDIVTL
ncbi:MAG: hypothetical protein WCG95_00430 [bacterium]